jgi:signal transduction histidine kinase/CheY-like chemotaxis protein
VQGLTRRNLSFMVPLAIGCGLAELIERSTAFEGTSFAPLGPTIGLAVGGALVLGWFAAPAVLVGVVVGGLLSGSEHAFVAAAAQAAGATLAVTITLRLSWPRSAAGRADEWEPADLRAFVLGVVVPAAGAGVAADVAALLLTGSDEPPWYLALSSWGGNALGILVIAPAMLAWSAGSRRSAAAAGASRSRWSAALRVGEGLALGTTLALVGGLVFGGWLPGRFATLPVAFTLFPVLAWALARFGARGATLAVAATALLATVGTLRGDGPFQRTTLHESLLLLQGFGLAVAATSLGMSALVTERVRREREGEAERQTALATLAGGLAHDLNNLLTPILGTLELVQGAFPEGSDERSRVDDAMLATRRASGLASQLLAFGRRSAVPVAPVPVGPLLEDAVRLLSDVATEGVEVRTFVAPGLPPLLLNPSQALQLVLNLVRNACQAVAGRGGVVSVVAREDGPGRVMIEVHDDGPGISPEVRDRMFDPFFTTRGLGGGTGLGLPVARGIVEQYGGSLSCRSKPGHGTTFVVVLPAIAEDEPVGRVARPPAVLAGPELAPSTGAPPRVLVADDEQTVLGLIASVLGRAGYEVLLARDGAEALELWLRNESTLDLVVLDLSMPVLGGGEVLRQIRVARPELPVIVQSGYAMLDDLDELARAGPTRLLPKPYSSTQLLAAVRESLRPGRAGPPTTPASCGSFAAGMGRPSTL